MPADELSPTELPFPSNVTVQKCTEEELRFGVPLSSNRVKTIWVATVPVGLAIVYWLFGDDIADLLRAVDVAADLLLLVVLGMSIVVPGMIFFLGRIEVDVDSARLVCRYHVSFVGFRRSMPTDSIRSITVEHGALGRPKDENAWLCKVRSEKRTMALTVFSNRKTAQTVARIMRYQLRRMEVLEGKPNDDAGPTEGET